MIKKERKIKMNKEKKYWIVTKDGEYVSGTDEFGYPLHTTDKEEAYRFYNNALASSFLSLGYSVIEQKG